MAIRSRPLERSRLAGLYLPGLRQMFGTGWQVEYDPWLDEYKVRTPDGKEYRYDLEMLMDGFVPSFPGYSYSASTAWGMPTARSLQTTLAYPGYQSIAQQQMDYTRLAQGLYPAPTPKLKPVPPSPTVQDSPNLKWLRGRVDEIRVPLEGLS